MASDPGVTGRDNNGRFMRTLEGAERDAEACRLKSRGRTYQQISDELGYGSKQAAHRAVKKALASIPSLNAEELRRIQLEQLDYMTDRVLAVMERDHLVVSQGGKIVMGLDGKPLIDDAPVLRASYQLGLIQQRRAKLQGLDAPIKHEVTLDYLDAQIAETTAELAAEIADGTEAGETDPAEGAEG
jgi:hypothetical protein